MLIDKFNSFKTSTKSTKDSPSILPPNNHARSRPKLKLKIIQISQILKIHWLNQEYSKVNRITNSNDKIRIQKTTGQH